MANRGDPHTSAFCAHLWPPFTSACAASTRTERRTLQDLGACLLLFYPTSRPIPSHALVLPCRHTVRISHAILSSISTQDTWNFGKVHKEHPRSKHPIKSQCAHPPPERPSKNEHSFNPQRQVAQYAVYSLLQLRLQHSLVI